MNIKQRIKDYIRSNFLDEIDTSVGVPGYKPAMTLVRGKEQAMKVATAYRWYLIFI